MGQKQISDFKDGEIVIELTSDQLLPGQQLNGFVHVNLREIFLSKGLYLSLNGYENVSYRTEDYFVAARNLVSKAEWLLIDYDNEISNCLITPG